MAVPAAAATDRPAGREGILRASVHRRDRANDDDDDGGARARLLWSAPAVPRHGDCSSQSSVSFYPPCRSDVRVRSLVTVATAVVNPSVLAVPIEDRRIFLVHSAIASQSYVRASPGWLAGDVQQLHDVSEQRVRVPQSDAEVRRRSE